MGEQDKYKILEFDIRGQICPSALLTSLHELNRHSEELKVGRVLLQIKTDNRDATVTIPNAVINMGYTVQTSKVDDYYSIEIWKKSGK